LLRPRQRGARIHGNGHPGWATPLLASDLIDTRSTGKGKDGGNFQGRLLPTSCREPQDQGTCTHHSDCGVHVLTVISHSSVTI